MLWCHIRWSEYDKTCLSGLRHFLSEYQSHKICLFFYDLETFHRQVCCLMVGGITINQTCPCHRPLDTTTIQESDSELPVKSKHLVCNFGVNADSQTVSFLCAGSFYIAEKGNYKECLKISKPCRMKLTLIILLQTREHLFRISQRNFTTQQSWG